METYALCVSPVVLLTVTGPVAYVGYDPSLNINEVTVLRYREASLTLAAEASRDWYLAVSRLAKFEHTH